VPLDTTDSGTCDPTLGCESAGGDPEVGAVLPTTLSLPTSQAASFALIALIVLLVVGLVVVPAFAWRYFSSKRAPS
jgi:hypothetical protein